MYVHIKYICLIMNQLAEWLNSDSMAKAQFSHTRNCRLELSLAIPLREEYNHIVRGEYGFHVLLLGLNETDEELNRIS